MAKTAATVLQRNMLPCADVWPRQTSFTLRESLAHEFTDDFFLKTALPPTASSTASSATPTTSAVTSAVTSVVTSAVTKQRK